MTEPSTQPLSDLLDSTPSVTDGMSSAFAKLYGEPLFKLPTDLYIPPDALEVFLEAFEGPLDLLLYLIRKQNFNVLDIPMAQVTLQYLSYIDQIRHHNLELAAEYLLMAAMLIEIKSRMLLPMKKADSDEEVDDPRAELVRRLLEYERMKLLADNSRNERQLQLSRYARVKDQVALDLANARHQYKISTEESGRYAIRSAMDGKVYKVLKEKGELVRRTEALAIVGSQNGFYLQLSVDEMDIRKVQTGQITYVKIDAFAGQTFHARVP